MDVDVEDVSSMQETTQEEIGISRKAEIGTSGKAENVISRKAVAKEEENEGCFRTR